MRVTVQKFIHLTDSGKNPDSALLVSHGMSTCLGSFAAAHRLKDHHGKCAKLHGHNWIVVVTLADCCPGEDGMIVDFHDIREIWKEDILPIFDHKVILQKSDPMAVHLSRFIEPEDVCLIEHPPTAESLAAVIGHKFAKLIVESFPDLRAWNMRICVEETLGSVGYADINCGILTPESAELVKDRTNLLFSFKDSEEEPEAPETAP